MKEPRDGGVWELDKFQQSFPPFSRLRQLKKKGKIKPEWERPKKK